MSPARTPVVEKPSQRSVDARNGGGQHVAEFQRARLLTAITEASAELGATSVTVADVVGRAGVSRRTFYDLFEDREECFLAALDAAIAQVFQRVVAADDPSAGWRERVRRGLIALLSCLDDNPQTARLLLVESLGAGMRAQERRDNVLAQVVPAIDGGRAGARVKPPPMTAEGAIGGVLSVLHGRLVNRDPRPLVELVNPLTSMIVLPYRGPGAAQAEFSRDTPSVVAASSRPVGENPLKELHMRLTYRTVRVLGAIAAHPGSSNRRLADVADIADQGQISKLLARLEQRGLIENQGAGATLGEPNAWRLTQRGHEVRATLAT